MHLTFIRKCNLKNDWAMPRLLTMLRYCLTHRAQLVVSLEGEGHQADGLVVLPTTCNPHLVLCQEATWVEHAGTLQVSCLSFITFVCRARTTDATILVVCLRLSTRRLPRHGGSQAQSQHLTLQRLSFREAPVPNDPASN